MISPRILTTRPTRSEMRALRQWADTLLGMKEYPSAVREAGLLYRLYERLRQDHFMDALRPHVPQPRRYQKEEG